jgi:hypothetical protein
MGRTKHLGAAIAAAAAMAAVAAAAGDRAPEVKFQTSDRCFACHNGLKTTAGEDVSIGYDWRASMMANSSRDPYWQGSVRRESTDHPESRAAIEDECSACHMPMTRYPAKMAGKLGGVFSHLPFDADQREGHAAQDGVSCSVCHQISTAKLGTRESFNGGFVIDPPAGKDDHREYGPFEVEAGHKRVMQTSSGGFVPQASAHVRDSRMCATCHSLYTEALGEGGKPVGSLPEQVPYQEWLHSEFRDKQSCQECHMPAVTGDVPVTNVIGAPRPGVRQHSFLAANFFMVRLLNRFRDELSVWAQPNELTAASEKTVAFLQERAARVTLESVDLNGGRLEAAVLVENFGGHKLPTAYPSRRAWLHVVVRDRNGRTVFESGAVRPDGSIAGNDNDEDGSRFEPHYAEITGADQVQIYEPVLKGLDGRPTTGLLTAVGYLKDNRILPRGFDKRTANDDVAVYGEAAGDDNFTAGSDRIRYRVALGAAEGPYEVSAELWYQPIGFRWANNLKKYGQLMEPRRFTGYYDAMGPASAVMLAHATAQR